MNIKSQLIEAGVATKVVADSVRHPRFFVSADTEISKKRLDVGETVFHDSRYIQPQKSKEVISFKQEELREIRAIKRLLQEQFEITTANQNYIKEKVDNIESGVLTHNELLRVMKQYPIDTVQLFSVLVLLSLFTTLLIGLISGLYLVHPHAIFVLLLSSVMGIMMSIAERKWRSKNRL